MVVFEIGTRLAVTASELTVVGAEVTDPVGRSEVRIRLVSEDWVMELGLSVRQC